MCLVGDKYEPAGASAVTSDSIVCSVGGGGGGGWYAAKHCYSYCLSFSLRWISQSNCLSIDYQSPPVSFKNLKVSP